MAARWRERVSEAERLQYGAGLLGALLLFISERRLPVSAYQAGRTVVRVGAASRLRRGARSWRSSSRPERSPSRSSARSSEGVWPETAPGAVADSR